MIWTRISSSIREVSLRDKRFLVSVVLAGMLLLAPYVSVFQRDYKLAAALAIVLICVGYISRVAYLFATLVLLTVTLFALHVRFHWGFSYLDSRAEAMILAPGYEVLEYMRAYFGFAEVLIFAYCFLTLTFIIRAAMTYGKRSCLLHALAVVALPILVVLIVSHRQGALASYPPVSVGRTVYQTIERLNSLDERRRFHTASSPERECGDVGYDTVVVAIGEAALKDRMGIYGYEKQTTPFLASIEPAVFDAISPTNQTRYSIPMMLTGATTEDFDAFYQSPSIITTLRECGYETFWISNQGKVGRFESNITTIAMEADKKYFINSLGWQQAGYDEQILEHLADASSRPGGKRAYFVHLIGSHVDYRKRYPSDRTMSPAVDVESHYDNTLYYTDHVLSRIFDLFRDDRLLLVYVSDHGEVVSNEKFGHGNFPSFKDEFRIPLVVWSDDRRRVSQLQAASTGKVINAESLDRFLGYLLGIDDEAQLSFSPTVFSVAPENRMDYRQLRFYDDSARTSELPVLARTDEMQGDPPVVMAPRR